MSDSNMMVNLANLNASSKTLKTASTGDSKLDIDDFYKLMAAQLQNQDMTNPTDQSEFINQMTQLAVVNAIDTFTNISITSYAASLVGKDVTVAASDSDGSTKEIYGTVTATGQYGGEQIIFVNDKSYKLTQIMAIGKLPESETTVTGDKKADEEDVDTDLDVNTDNNTGADTGIETNAESETQSGTQTETNAEA